MAKRVKIPKLDKGWAIRELFTLFEKTKVSRQPNLAVKCLELIIELKGINKQKEEIDILHVYKGNPKKIKPENG